MGSFVLPEKADGPYITIRSSVPDSALPPADTRITPSYAGALPKIVSPGCNIPALQTMPGAHHFQFIGVEFQQANDGVLLNTLVLLGAGDSTQTALSQVPHHLVFDRVYIHGLPTSNLQHCVGLQSASTTISNSYISDCHAVGFDAQALVGWNGPGPFQIVNNYLEGSGENVMFGGAAPTILNLVPSDIEIRQNHFSKPLSWKADDPSYAGIHWSVKNLFELKNAQRVLVDGNILENNWADSQVGFAIQLTPRNEDGTAPWSAVRDVTFTNNIVRHTSDGINILGSDDRPCCPSQQAQNILLQNNLFDDVSGPRWGGNGILFQVVRGPANLAIKNNTAVHSGSFIVADSAPSSQGFVFTNNIVEVNLYGITGTGTGVGTSTLNAYFPGYVFSNNVIAGPWPSPAGATTSMFPNNPPASPTFFPMTLADVGFLNLAGGDYRLDPATSPFATAGTNGGAVGVDWVAFTAAQAVSQVAADITPPLPPANLVAAVVNGVPSLTWAPNGESDLAGYKVHYGIASGTYGPALDLGNATNVPLTALNLLAGATYYFTVTAYDTARNESSFSNEVTLLTAIPGSGPPSDPAPAAPLNLHTLTGLAGLAWDPNTEGDLAGYKVYYGTAPGVYGSVLNVRNVTSVPLTALNLLAVGTYYFAVTAYDTANHESAYSNEVSLTLP